MNPTIKAKWLEALRSGKYEQTTGALHDKDGFCCLGVLCDVHRQETGGEWMEYDGADAAQQRHKGLMQYQGGTGVLPYEVMEWAEMESQVPEVGPYAEYASVTVADLNDGYKDGQPIPPLTFLQIANMIEDRL